MEGLFPQEVQPILMEMKNLIPSVHKARSVTSKGYKFIPGFNPETAEFFMKEYDMPENTVYISSFPKTGTNWTLEIVCQILFIKDPKSLQLLKRAPIPLFVLEIGPKEKFELLKYLPVPRLTFATHLADEWFDFEKMKRKNGKMVYVIRNPKDQLVSWFHFTKKLPLVPELRKEMGLDDWSEFFQRCVSGKHPMGVKEGEWYPEHILGWLKYRDDKNMLFVVFEDLKKDLKKEVARIAEFLEVKLSEEETATVIQACTFQNMKEGIDQGQTHSSNVRNQMGFLRKGNVGDWKNHFTVAQSEYVDKIIEERLSHTGIKFTYEL